MKEKEYNVARARHDVREAESKVRDAKRNLDEGYREELAKVEQAKASMEKTYSNLKEELERAQIELDREKDALKFAEAEMARGYEA